MAEGPDIALIGSLIGDPARANILTILMSGKALTATELALEAGVTKQTVSSHLKKLEEIKLIKRVINGRHHYFTLYDQAVADMIEAISGLAANRGLSRVRTGPKDMALCKARVCYNHLAGEMGVLFYDQMLAHQYLIEQGEAVGLTPKGTAFIGELGIDVTSLIKGKNRALCKPCLDWSSRRPHLAGPLGTAVLKQIFELGWAKQKDCSRIVEFTNDGETKMRQLFSFYG